MTEETLNDYVNKIQSFNMNEDKRFDEVHLKDALMAGYNICRSECEKADLEIAIRIGALEEENTKLKERIEEMRCCGNCRHFLEQNPQRCSYCFELCEWELK